MNAPLPDDASSVPAPVLANPAAVPGGASATARQPATAGAGTSTVRLSAEEREAIERVSAEQV